MRLRTILPDPVNVHTEVFARNVRLHTPLELGKLQCACACVCVCGVKKVYIRTVMHPINVRTVKRLVNR